jgi:hypothetical protein
MSKTKILPIGESLKQEALGYMADLVQTPYTGDHHMSSFYGDIENNHKWFIHKERSIFTFKPCKDDSRVYVDDKNQSDIEKKLQIGRVHFYGQYESNKISISAFVNTPNYLTIKFQAHTLDDSSLSLWWEFNSMEQSNDIKELISSLYKIITDIDVFSQEEFLIAFELEDIKMPNHCDTD